MKELLNLAANFCATLHDDGLLRPNIELALITSEPIYSCDAAGESIRTREVETYRFAVTPKQARALARQLETLAEDAETNITGAVKKTQEEGAKS